MRWEYLVIAVTSLNLSCKPEADDSNVKTLDNFAAQSLIKVNVCDGSKKAKSSVAVKTLVDSAENTPATDFKDDIQASVSAVPQSLLQVFIGLGGKIRVTNMADLLCGAAVNDATHFEKTKVPDACFVVGSSPDSPLEIIVNADKGTIRHNIVREFGYIYAQIVSKSVITPAPNGRYSFKATSVDQGAAGRFKKAIRTAFLKDVGYSPYFKLSTLDSLLGGQSKAVAANIKAGLADPMTGVNLSPEALGQLSDYIFAEAFDSYYCNAVAPVDSALLANLSSKKAADLKTNLAKINNTRVIMSALFGETFNAFQTANKRLFARPRSATRPAPKASFRLDGIEDSCEDTGLLDPLDSLTAQTNQHVYPGEIDNDEAGIGDGNQIAGDGATSFGLDAAINTLSPELAESDPENPSAGGSLLVESGSAAEAFALGDIVKACKSIAGVDTLAKLNSVKQKLKPGAFEEGIADINKYAKPEGSFGAGGLHRLEARNTSRFQEIVNEPDLLNKVTRKEVVEIEQAAAITKGQLANFNALSAKSMGMTPEAKKAVVVTLKKQLFEAEDVATRARRAWPDRYKPFDEKTP